MQNVRQPVSHDDAINDLIAMGLVDVVFDAELGPMYRLSERIYAEDFVPNAALCDRLEKRNAPC